MGSLIFPKIDLTFNFIIKKCNINSPWGSGEKKISSEIHSALCEHSIRAEIYLPSITPNILNRRYRVSKRSKGDGVRKFDNQMILIRECNAVLFRNSSFVLIKLNRNSRLYLKSYLLCLFGSRLCEWKIPLETNNFWAHLDL